MRRRIPFALVLTLYFGGLSGTGLGREQAQVTMPAAISGVVVDATSGRPLSKAIVTLNMSGRSPARLLTDAKGRFLLRGLPAGDTYTLTATKAGYFDGFYGTKRGRSGRAITLADGQWFPDARIELVHTSSISGTVIDEAGEPVVGAFVRVLAQLWVGGQQQWAPSEPIKTDDRGQYRMGGLAAGSYLVSLPSMQNAMPVDPAPETAANSRTSSGPALDLDPTARLVIGNFATPPPPAVAAPTLAYPAVFFPGTQQIAAADVITLAEAEDRAGVDVQVRPVPTWRVSGQLDPSNGPVAGLTMRLLAVGTENLGFGSEVATTFADRSGRFTFLNVPAGHYKLDARMSMMEVRYQPSGGVSFQPYPFPGLLNGRGGGGDALSGPRGTVYTYTNLSSPLTTWARAEVEVSSGDISNIVVPTHTSVTLTGRAVWERNGVPAASGSRIAALMAEPVGPASLGMPSGTIAAGATTTFTVSGLLSGKYLLRPLGGGMLKSIVWDGQDYTYTPFDASAGHDFQDVVITFTDKTTSLSGVASDGQGGLGGAVLVFPTTREEWTSLGFRPLRLQSIETSTAGRYVVTMPEGEYYVVALDATAVDAWQTPGFLERAARVASRVTLAWGDAKVMNLRTSEVR